MWGFIEEDQNQWTQSIMHKDELKDEDWGFIEDQNQWTQSIMHKDELKDEDDAQSADCRWQKGLRESTVGVGIDGERRRSYEDVKSENVSSRYLVELEAQLRWLEKNITELKSGID